MTVFFKNTSLEEAINLSKSICKKIDIETEVIETVESLSRVTSKAHYSKISSPHFTASAMDGIATCFDYTLKASKNKPVILKSNMYEVVDTGDIVEAPFNCVIMIEDVEEIENGYIITTPATLYQNVRSIGEDIREGEMIVSRNKVITPIEISSLLASKITKLEVYKYIKVGIIPTGDEIVEATKEGLPKKGELIDYNSWTFKALIESYGAKGIRYNAVKDNKEELKKAIIKATNECDIVILNAGSSKGRGDFSVDIVSEIGEKYFHGLAIKPGKPTSIGLVNNTPIYGVPGYPVSAFFVIESIIKPGIIEILNKIKNVNIESETIEAILSKKVVSSLKYDEYIRVRLSQIGDNIVASPLGKGGSATMSLTNSDGYFIVPKNLEGLEASDKVKVNLFRKDFNAKRNLLISGSYDCSLNIIRNYLKDYNIDVSPNYASSIGGIMALKRNETHLAFCSLLGEQGDYNVDYCKKYLEDFIIIKYLKRTQGLIVAKGNPLNINDLKDLERITFVNRQKGSGTRIIIDKYLAKCGINKSLIKGYDREEITHLAVAAQVKGNSADCGFGTLSSAREMDLDFIPICEEDLDIIINKDQIEDYRIKTFLNIVKSKEFKEKLNTIAGYKFNG